MRARAVETRSFVGGRIVNLSGTSGLRGYRNRVAYDVITGISEGMARDPGCLIDALHLFAFGNVAATADWLKAFTRDG